MRNAIADFEAEIAAAGARVVRAEIDFDTDNWKADVTLERGGRARVIVTKEAVSDEGPARTSLLRALGKTLRTETATSGRLITVSYGLGVTDSRNHPNIR